MTPRAAIAAALADPARARDPAVRDALFLGTMTGHVDERKAARDALVQWREGERRSPFRRVGRR